MKNQKKYGIVIMLGVAAITIVAEIILLMGMGKPVYETLLVVGLLAVGGGLRLLFPYFLI